MGARDNDESLVSTTLQFRYNFEEQILLRGGGEL